MDLRSLHVHSTASNSSPPAQTMHDSNIRSQNEQYDQDYLDRYNLVIGMAGKLIKRHVAKIEKKLGKPGSTL